eukprot:1195742-Prorocentrum_minimum.AAC.2
MTSLGLSPYPFWDEGLAGNKRSPPGLPLLASTQLPYGSQPSVQHSGFPHAVWHRHSTSSGNSPVFVNEGNSRNWKCLSPGTGGSLVKNRLGSPIIRVPTLAGNRRSSHLTERCLVSPRS